MDIVVIRMASRHPKAEKLFLPHTAWGHPKVNLGGLNDADLASINQIDFKWLLQHILGLDTIFKLTSQCRRCTVGWCRMHIGINKWVRWRRCIYIYNIEVNSWHGVTTGIEAALFADPFWTTNSRKSKNYSDLKELSGKMMLDLEHWRSLPTGHITRFPSVRLFGNGTANVSNSKVPHRSGHQHQKHGMALQF